MFSTLTSVASSGGDAMTMSRSSARILCTHLMVFLALGLSAASTVKSTSYLFLKYRASFARSPASASTTGDDSSPTVETSLKSTAYDMARTLSLVNRRSARWVGNVNEDNEHRRSGLAGEAGLG